MPSVSRYFFKTAVVCLILALVLRVFLSACGEGARFDPVFYHLLTVGWITQVIFGVAHWMFPRHTRENPRGDERFVWLVYFLLNTGLALRVLGEGFLSMESGSLLRLALVVSAVFQFGAIALFAAQIWKRVK